MQRRVGLSPPSGCPLHGRWPRNAQRGKLKLELQLPGSTMYEVFDHTADLGLRVQAKTLNDLFAEAGRGFTSLVVEDPESVQPQEEFRLELAGTDREYLLFDWLSELLYRFETQEQLFSKFVVSVTDDGLQATAFGETVDPDRHRLSHEVKAITYHHLKVERTDDGWLAEVIVDI